MRAALVAAALCVALVWSEVEVASLTPLEIDERLLDSTSGTAASTGSDGGTRLGHIGDYSSWLRKYHLGKHEVRVAKQVYPSTEPKQTSEVPKAAETAKKKKATAKATKAQPAPKPAAKATEAKAQEAKPAKVPDVKAAAAPATPADAKADTKAPAKTADAKAAHKKAATDSKTTPAKKEVPAATKKTVVKQKSADATAAHAKAGEHKQSQKATSKQPAKHKAGEAAHPKTKARAWPTHEKVVSHDSEVPAAQLGAEKTVAAKAIRDGAKAQVTPIDAHQAQMVRTKHVLTAMDTELAKLEEWAKP